MACRPSTWICFTLACMASMLDFSLVFTFGALFVEMMNTYRTDRATAATVHSLLIGVSLSFGVVSGILINKFGLPKVTFAASVMVPFGFCISFFITDIHYLYISIGVVAGAGISMIHISAVTSVSRIFTGKKKLLCATIHNTSAALSGIVYPYFLKWLTKSYGLSGTFLILGGVYSNTFVFFVFIWLQASSEYLQLKHLDENEDDTRNTSQSTTKGCACASPFHVLGLSGQLLSIPFIFLVVGNGLAISTFNVYLELAFDIAEWKGYNESETKTFFILYFCFNVFASFVPGLVKRKLRVNTYIFLMLSSLSGSIGHLLFYLSSGYAMYATASCCVGLLAGGIISSSVILIMERMHGDQVSVATGLVFTVNGLLSAGTGPLFGRVRDISGTYDTVLITICLSQAISTLLYFLALIFQRHRNNSTITSVPPGNEREV